MRVPFSVVTHPFASPVVRLARIARMRLAVVAVLVLAVSMALGGLANAAMPDIAATTGAGGMCDHASSTSPMKHAHCSDGCCKVACACAFTYAIGFVPPLWLAIAPIHTLVPVPKEEAASAGSATPQLRPPIA
jgi:hypothetical protein